MDALPDLRRPELYLNRELSLLAFNRRVLAQAQDARVPLLERLRFLCILCTNLDEFFEVRVAGIKEQAALATLAGLPDASAAAALLVAISQDAHRLVADQYQVLDAELIPALAAQGIRLLPRDQWDAAQVAWLRSYFDAELAPVLSPLGLDPAHPFPRILNKSLNLVVALSGVDGFGRDADIAIVQAPRALPRVIALPPELCHGGRCFVLLSSVIHAFLDALFPAIEVQGCYPFRVTRNSDLFVDEEEVDDLKRALQGELPSRRYGDAVRLEVAHDCPDELVAYLLTRFGLVEADLYRIPGPINLHRLQAIYDELVRPELKYPPLSPGVPAALSRGADLYAVIAREDILLHHPYESFGPVLEFVQRAASDPAVLAIKQTLYRTGADSVIVDALLAAARAGKEVTVVIELRARFDEEANIALADRLEEAGAHVVYGVVGYKTHAKCTLVVRREGTTLRHYVHLGTGNYHPRTARAYSDYGLLTGDPDLGADVHQLFLALTSLGAAPRLRKLIAAPFTLASALAERIEREARHAEAGHRARLVFKVNSLTDPGLIEALYRASCAGVQVDLIVRGMCVLRPGVPGVSDHIRVRSIVGRFLEHARVFYFLNHGHPEVYLSSADAMERNLHRRVELAVPLRDSTLRRRVVEDLELALADTAQAWLMQADGAYERAPRPAEGGTCVQELLLARYANQANVSV